MFPKDIENLSSRLKEFCSAKGLKVALAESCTGGLIGGALTEISGSSSYFQGSAGTYSNEAKKTLLSVPSEVIDAHGAVSSKCAEAMAKGALRLYDADIALSVTGIAGPDGGSDEKPVGTVWFGLATAAGKISSFRKIFYGTRADVRMGAVRTALLALISELEGESR